MASVAAITVTFHSDLALLETQLQALQDVRRRIVVDNASPPESRPALRQVVQRTGGELIELSENRGLAAGLNAGICRACSDDNVRTVLLLDQDSVFERSVPQAMLSALHDIQIATGKLACVGPTMLDVSSGLSHGFHVIRGWRWARIYPPADTKTFLPVANLNGSGIMASVELIEQAGLMEEQLFIDHIDTEWSFRVLSKGFRLYGLPWLAFRHIMGESSRRFWLFGWRVWPQRSPLRHYYLFRNTVRLLRRNYVPPTWKGWAVVKLILTICVTTIMDKRRTMQLRMMLRGVIAGSRGRDG